MKKRVESSLQKPVFVILLAFLLIIPFAAAHPGELHLKQTNGPSAGAIKFGMGFSDSNPDVIYVDRYKSTDGGNSWKEMDLPEDAVNSIAVDPNNKNVIYLAMASQLYKSSDGGSSWKIKDIGTEDSVISAIEINPVNAKEIFVGNTHGKLFFSGNSGNSWKDVSHLLEVSSPISRIAFNPLNTQEVYISTGNWYLSSLVSRTKTGEGLFKSFDGGKTFEKLQNEFSNLLVQDVDVLGEIVYVTTHSEPDLRSEWFGVFKSTDKGKSWQKILDSRQYNTAKLTHISVNPNNEEHLIVSGSDNIPFLLSYDGGLTWDKVNTDSSEPIQYTHELEFAGNNVYAVSYYKPFLKSIDGGKNWEWSADGISKSTITSLEIHPLNRNAVLAGTFDGAVHLTYDGGMRWDRFFDGDYAGSYVASIEFDPDNSRKLFIGVSGPIDTKTGRYYGAPWVDTGLYISENAGKWSKLPGLIHPLSGENFQLEIYDILIHPTKPNIILLGTSSEGIYKSEDSGKTWQESNNGIPEQGFYWNLNLEPEGYTPAEECKERYERYKKGEKVEPGCFYFATKTSMNLFVNPHNENEILYTTLNGVFVSEDLGENWEWLSDDLKNIHVHFMAFDPSDENIIYLGTHQGAIADDGNVIDSSKGLLISRDSGKTWKQISSGPGKGHDIRAIAVNSEDPRFVVVATKDPIYVSQDKGKTWGKITNKKISEANEIRIDKTAKVIYLGTGKKGVWRGIVDYEADSPAIIEVTGVHFPPSTSENGFSVMVSVDNIGSTSGEISLNLKAGEKEGTRKISVPPTGQKSVEFTFSLPEGEHSVFLNGINYGTLSVGSEVAQQVIIETTDMPEATEIEEKTQDSEGIDAKKLFVEIFKKTFWPVFIIMFIAIIIIAGKKVYKGRK